MKKTATQVVTLLVKEPTVSSVTEKRNYGRITAHSATAGI